MLCHVLSGIHYGGRRFGAGDEVNLDADAYRRFIELGCVQLVAKRDRMGAAEAEADRLRAEAAAEGAEAEAAMLAEAEAEAAEAAFAALDRDALKALIEEHGLEDINIRLGTDKLREEVAAALALRAEADGPAEPF